MRRFNLLVLVTVIAFSCGKSDVDSFGTSQSFDCSICATLPEMESSQLDTKASLSYVVRLGWVKGDKISVFNATTRKALGGSLVADADGSIVTFSGNLTGTVNAGDRLLFLYPGQNYTSEQDVSQLDFDFSTQDGTSSNKVPFVVSASTVAESSSSSLSGLNLTFSYLITFVQIALADLPASRSIEEVRLTGLFDHLKLTLGSTSFSPTVSTSADYIRLNPTTSLSASGNRTIFFTAPAQTTNSNRTIMVRTGGEDYTIPFTSAALSVGYNYRAASTTFGGFHDTPVVPTDPAGGNVTETTPGGEFGE